MLGTNSQFLIIGSKGQPSMDAPAHRAEQWASACKLGLPYGTEAHGVLRGDVLRGDADGIFGRLGGGEPRCEEHGSN